MGGLGAAEGSGIAFVGSGQNLACTPSKVFVSFKIQPQNMFFHSNNLKKRGKHTIGELVSVLTA